MSKMDGLRAMREARYEQRMARAPKPATTPQGTAKLASPPATKPAAGSGRTPSAAATPEAPTEKLCGHRAISGRTCTREHGHAAKSHRYS